MIRVVLLLGISLTVGQPRAFGACRDAFDRLSKPTSEEAARDLRISEELDALLGKGIEPLKFDPPPVAEVTIVEKAVGNLNSALREAGAIVEISDSAKQWLAHENVGAGLNEKNTDVIIEQNLIAPVLAAVGKPSSGNSIVLQVVLERGSDQLTIRRQTSSSINELQYQFDTASGLAGMDALAKRTQVLSYIEKTNRDFATAKNPRKIVMREAALRWLAQLNVEKSSEVKIEYENYRRALRQYLEAPMIEKTGVATGRTEIIVDYLGGDRLHFTAIAAR